MVYLHNLISNRSRIYVSLEETFVVICDQTDCNSRGGNGGQNMDSNKLNYFTNAVINHLGMNYQIH